MTRNQRLVMVWFEDHCNALGIVRVSASEIALIFGWSEQYTKKILRSLIEDGSLERLQIGAGHRAAKYKVSSRGNQNRSRGNQRESLHHVPSGNPFGVGPFRYSNNPRNNTRDNAYPEAHIRKGALFDGVEHPIKPVSTRGSPFKRFRTHYDNVEKWTGPDFVCYFSYVFRVRFGETPDLNWPIEVGCARTLLKRLKRPDLFKTFIQVAFLIAKRKPNGLRSFVYDYAYENIVAQDPSDDELDDFEDDYVFPWLAVERKKTSTKVQDDYTRQLLKTYLGI